MKKKHSVPKDMFIYEREARANHPDLVIAGVDEAGRGPLAGPVVVAAVILPIDEHEFDLPVDDSKVLSESKRKELDRALRSDPRIRWCVALRSAAEVDRINILQATHAAMRESVLKFLENPPDLVFVDGLRVKDFPTDARFIVKGDGHSASIAAASIIAKTWRDRMMVELDKQYPEYGFAQHKGYGTARHLQALQKFGPCPEHRRSFSPVARVCSPPPEQLTLSL